jgi:hypothetical protein
MLTPLLIIMLGASSAEAMNSFTLKAQAPARCSGKCAEKYRLQLTDDDGADAKSRAMSMNSSKCNVVGAQRCLTKRRLMWSSDDRGPIAALAGTLGLR